MKKLLFLSFFLCPFLAFSQVSSIVGSWKSIDDETGEAKSVVRIYKGTDGKYYGKIEKLFKNPDDKCDKCTGENKDKPIVGMVIITGMKVNGDKLDGGNILDPGNGKTYYASLSIDKDGRLKVRGSLDKWGVAGRSQFWVKAE